MRSVWLAVACALAVGGCGKAETSPSPQQLAYLEQLNAHEQRLLEAQRAEERRRAEEEARIAEQQRIAEGYRIGISVVLAEDDRAARTGGGGGAIADRMSQIDLSATPNDFRSAYSTHIDAWKRSAQIQAALRQLKSDDRMGPAMVGGILATIFEVDVSPFSDHVRAIQKLEEEAKSASALVDSSFSTVKSVAAQYGASPPASGGGGSAM